MVPISDAALPAKGDRSECWGLIHRRDFNPHPRQVPDALGYLESDNCSRSQGYDFKVLGFTSKHHCLLFPVVGKKNQTKKAKRQQCTRVLSNAQSTKGLSSSLDRKGTEIITSPVCWQVSCTPCSVLHGLSAVTCRRQQPTDPLPAVPTQQAAELCRAQRSLPLLLGWDTQSDSHHDGKSCSAIARLLQI